MKINKRKWQQVRFDQVVNYKKLTVDAEASGLERYIAGEHMSTEDLHLRKWGRIGDGYLGPAFHSKFESGDILYGSRRTYLKKVALADFDGITSNTTFVLKENTDIVIPGFIPFLMLSQDFTQHSVKNSKGSVNPYINFKDIGKFEFLLPPKDQQKTLAELLWAGDNVVEQYLVTIEKLRALSAVQIQKYNGGAYVKTQLGECLRQIKEVSLAPHKIERYVGLEHITSGSFKCNTYAPSEIAEANCFQFKKGDLLYSKLRPYLDKAFIADFDGVCTTELMVLETVNADKDYVLNVLHSPGFVEYVNSKSFGTKMPRTSFAIVSSYPFYFPKPKEQKRIAEELNQIQINIGQAQKAMAHVKQLNGAIINQIFSN